MGRDLASLAKPTALLGGLTPATFLRRHWQKRPLLVRQALPGFQGIVDRDALFALATRGDAISRLVIEHPGRRPSARWERHDGPFGAIEPGMLPASRWTLLVHGVEGLVPGGWELLSAFDFVPLARVDDLMVSFAADGGSVGPHDDRYDVFLLQGPGRRRWRIQRGGERALDPEASIKVLRAFEPEEEWVLEPGDLLYLPPGVAHHGIAEGPCFTYSIGFLAPSQGELVQAFLGYLAEVLEHRLDPRAIYEDPDLTPAADPLAIGDPMLGRFRGALGGIRWDRGDVEDFVGRFLTRPKAHNVFPAPRRPLAEAAFVRRLRGRGQLALALPSRGLVRPGQLFFNGEAHRADRATLRLFAQLVRGRSLSLPLAPPPPLARRLLYAWWRAGFLTLSARPAGARPGEGARRRPRSSAGKPGSRSGTARRTRRKTRSRR